MKKSSLIFGPSLVVNYVLIALIVVGSVAKFASKPVEAIAASAVVPRPESPPIPEIWSTLKTDDLGQLAARLRAEEFPEWAVRAVVTARVHESFRARHKAIDAAQPDVPYWRKISPDPNRQAELRALAREEQDAVTAVLGRDPDRYAVVQLRANLPHLAAERIERLADIQDHYLEKRLQVRNPGSITTPDEREKLDQLDKAMRAEFAAVLTPDEMEEYEMRTSSVASSLRYQLGNFELSEGEFRAVYRLKAEFQQQFPSFNMEGRSESENHMETQIAAELGAARYAEYKRATDYSYRQASMLVARTGLAPEIADVLYRTQREFEQRRDAIYAAQKGNREGMITDLRTLHTEATTRLNTVFGGNATLLGLYREYGGNWWANLEQR